FLACPYGATREPLGGMDSRSLRPRPPRHRPLAVRARRGSALATGRQGSGRTIVVACRPVRCRGDRVADRLGLTLGGVGRPSAVGTHGPAPALDDRSTLAAPRRATADRLRLGPPAPVDRSDRA